MRTTLLVLIGLAALLTASLSPPANAEGGGIAGYSGREGVTCTECHSTSTPPTVTVTGPTTVSSGSTATYILSVSPSVGRRGGLDVSVTGGTLVAGAGTWILGGELTHTEGSLDLSWTFSWTAPTVSADTTVTMYAAAVNGRGSGTGTGTTTLSITVTAPPPPPTLAVSPSSLSFTYEEGAAAPASRTLTVSSSGDPLSYTVSTSDSWLSASGGGTTPGTVTVSVAAGLSAGTYTGTVTIASAGASNSPVTVSVTLRVTEPPPGSATLVVTPTELAFRVKHGEPPSSKKIRVTSTGERLRFTVAAPEVSWLRVGPLGGKTPAKLEVAPKMARLRPGTYTTQVRITGGGETKVVSVRVVVVPRGGGDKTEEVDD